MNNKDKLYLTIVKKAIDINNDKLKKDEVKKEELINFIKSLYEKKEGD